MLTGKAGREASQRRSAKTRLLRWIVGALAAATLPALPALPADADDSTAGSAAAAAALRHVHLPPGFHIALYALVPGARQLAVAPHTDTVMVGTQGDGVWRLERNGDTARPSPYAREVQFDMPNGVCWTPGGDLVVAEFDAVRRFDGAEHMGALAPPPRDVVPAGHLVPGIVTGRGHGARVCKIGPDGRVYVAIGQPHNVPPKDRLAVYAQWGVGGIVSFDARDGRDSAPARDGAVGPVRTVYARGIRNSVGLDFNPADGTLWFTDNQTDGMGDDTPPGEINRATRAGQHFGYPYLGGRAVRIPDYAHDAPPPDAVPPQVETVAHAADLGMVFYRGAAFPAPYRGAIFSAQHGSWNRSVPVGAQLLLTHLKADGTAADTSVFAAGWLDAATGRYRGRPVDVAVLQDGSLLVSDDLVGAVYRVTYDPGSAATQ